MLIIRNLNLIGVQSWTYLTELPRLRFNSIHGFPFFFLYGYMGMGLRLGARRRSAITTKEVKALLVVFQLLYFAQ